MSNTVISITKSIYHVVIGMKNFKKKMLKFKE